MFALSADVVKKIMKLFENNNVIVIDNFLTTEEFEITKKESQKLPYEKIPLGVDPWYKLNTGDIYKTQKKYWSDNPEQFKIFFDKLSSVNLVKCEKFSLMVHAYAAGAEIDWHKDVWPIHRQHLFGSYSFYIHDRWESTWGGNLLVADISTNGTDEEENKSYNSVSVFSQTDKILNPGYGTYFAPIPNRLVIIKEVYHKVERIDPSIGNNCRISLTGFFQGMN
jgi:Rps23 Pro-64 3,4-dihydroxylase Tpa1-like proline 4-hydroxylase